MGRNTRDEARALKDNIIAAYVPGVTTHEQLAHQFGVTRPYVTELLSEQSAAHKAAASRAASMLSEILELSDLSIPEVATLLTTSRQVLHRWLDSTMPEPIFFKRIELLYRALKNAAGQKSDE